MNLDQINHLSLVGRLTLNLASLNNEGTEGNAIQPRTATVVLDGKLHSVPVISGDMLKALACKAPQRARAGERSPAQRQCRPSQS